MSKKIADDKRELVRQLFEEVINAHAIVLVDEFYHPAYVQHNPNVPQGIAGLKEFLSMLFAAFPDLSGSISSLIAEHDRVMVLVEWRGTHLGAFAGIPPSGNSVRFRSAEIFRIEAGRFAEHWDVIDNTEMQLALGILVPRQGLSA